MCLVFHQVLRIDSYFWCLVPKASRCLPEVQPYMRIGWIASLSSLVFPSSPFVMLICLLRLPTVTILGLRFSRTWTEHVTVKRGRSGLTSSKASCTGNRSHVSIVSAITSFGLSLKSRHTWWRAWRLHRKRHSIWPSIPTGTEYGSPEAGLWHH